MRFWCELARLCSSLVQEFISAVIDQENGTITLLFSSLTHLIPLPKLLPSQLHSRLATPKSLPAPR